MVIVVREGHWRVGHLFLFRMRDREENFTKVKLASGLMGVSIASTDFSELEHGRPSVEAIRTPRVPARLHWVWGQGTRTLEG